MAYVHHVPGRLRVRAACVKGGARPNALKAWLESLEGVERVDVSGVTGSVLIHYRVGRTDGDRLLALMCDRGWIDVSPARASRAPVAAEHATNVVVRYLAELALERCLLALCAAVF